MRRVLRGEGGRSAIRYLDPGRWHDLASRRRLVRALVRSRTPSSCPMSQPGPVRLAVQHRGRVLTLTEPLAGEEPAGDERSDPGMRYWTATSALWPDREPAPLWLCRRNDPGRNPARTPSGRVNYLADGDVASTLVVLAWS